MFFGFLLVILEVDSGDSGTVSITCSTDLLIYFSIYDRGSIWMIWPIIQLRGVIQ